MFSVVDTSFVFINANVKETQNGTAPKHRPRS